MTESSPISTEDESQWARLESIYESERRGGRVLVVSSSEPVRAEVRRRLELRAPSMQRIEPNRDVAAHILDFAQRAPRKNDGPLPVAWLEAQSVTGNEQWLDALEILDRNLDLLNTNSPVFVVFAGPPTVQQLLQQRTPDMMSVINPVIVLREARVEAPMVEHITWLHLSDLHVSPNDPEQDVVFGALRRDLPRLLKHHGLAPQLAFVTGDIAWRGQREEFARAKGQLESIMEDLGLSPSKSLFLVPGNHDVDRSRIRGMVLGDQKQVLALRGTEFCTTVGERIDAPKDLRSYGERLSEWCRFTESLLGSGRGVAVERPWRVDVEERGGIRVGVASMCSAWMSGPDDDCKGRVVLGERQIRALVAALDHENAQLRIALLHHPLSWLHEAEDRTVEELLRHNFDVVLHGHLHDPRAEVTMLAEHKLAVVSAGAVYAGPDADRYHGISVGRFDPRAAELRTWFFTWTSRGEGRWCLDSAVSPQMQQDGSVALPLHAPGVKQLLANHDETPRRSPPPALPNDDPRSLLEELLNREIIHRAHGLLNDILELRSSSDGLVDSIKWRQRVLEIEGYACTFHRVSLGAPATGDNHIIDMLVGIHPERPFVVEPGFKQHWINGDDALSSFVENIRRLGGEVRLHAFGTTAKTPIDGLDVTPVTEVVLDPLREGLATHARSCHSAWTAQQENAYVAGHLNRGDGSSHPADETLRSALGSGFTLLLGDYGTGKTTQLARLAASLAKEHLESSRPLRIAPVVLSLTGRKPELEALLAEQLPEVETARLHLAIEMGLVPLLLDGLDELDLDPHDVPNVLAKLLGSLVGSRARVIVAGRRSFFSTEQLERAIAAVDGLEALRLREFDEEEIEQFVGQATRTPTEAMATLAKIQNTYDLKGLAPRPALLDLIVSQRKRLDTKEMTAATLYQLVTEEWLGSRDNQQEFLTYERRLAFARTLARLLHIQQRKSASFQEVAKLVVDILPADRLTTIDRATLQVHTTVFLACDPHTNHFRFAHHSFLEYFLAFDIDRRLATEAPDALLLHRPSPEVFEFLAGLPNAEDRLQRLRRILTAPYCETTSENALLALVYTGREQCRDSTSLELSTRLDELLPHRAQLAGADLSQLDLSWVSLVSANLANAKLTATVLDYADLTDANLTSAILAHASLDGACLNGACLDDADLFRASMLEAETQGTRFDRTQLQATVSHSPISGQPRPPLGPPVLTWPWASASTLAWSPDGRWLALADLGSVRIIDATTGECIRKLEGHSRPVKAIVFSHDNRTIVSASVDKMVRIWRIQDGQCLHILKGHSKTVNAVTISSDGHTIASASDDETVRIWRIHDGHCIRTLSGHSALVLSTAFSYDGNTVASASTDGSVRIWRVLDGQCIRTLNGHSALVLSVAFSHDGNTIASASVDKTVRIWRIQDGQCIRTLNGHSAPVWSVTFSHNGHTIVSASSDKTIRTWRLQDGQCIRTISGHSSTVKAVAFSHDRHVVASAYDDQTIRLWRVHDGKYLRTLEGHRHAVKAVEFSHNGHIIASASDDNTVRLWRAQDGKHLHTLEGHSRTVNSVAVSQDGHVIASASDDNTVRLWRAQDGKHLHTLKGHSRAVNSVAVSREGHVIASASDDNTIRLWRVHDGKYLHTLEGHSRAIKAVAFSHDGNTIASASSDKTVRLWRVRDGQCLRTLENPSALILSMAFSHDGHTIATASSNKVHIWRIRDGQCHRELDGHSSLTLSVAFSRDGHAIASASDDNTIIIWRVRDGRRLRTLRSHSSAVNAVAFSNEGRTIVSASDDNTIRIWRIEDGKCLAILAASHHGWVCIAAGTPFFHGEGDFFDLRVRSGDRLVLPEIWTPLLQRPDLVQMALAGKPIDLAAHGLGPNDDAWALLMEERQRRGLARRRVVGTKREKPR